MAKRLIAAAFLCILNAVESHGVGIHSSSSSHTNRIPIAFSSTSIQSLSRPALLLSSSYNTHTKLSPRCKLTTNAFKCISSHSIIQQQRVNARISNLYLSASPTQAQEEEATPKQITNDVVSSFNPESNDDDNEKLIIIIIGGSGFLGTEIRKQLKDRDIQYIATATTQKVDRDGEEFVSLDLTASDSEEQFHQLIATTTQQSNNEKKRVAVISTMGSIGTNRDEEVNAALSRAIKGAYRINKYDREEDDGDKKKVVVERFVMIGNTKRVRRLASNLPFLKGYARGKEDAESALRECFGDQGCIIKPTFIYGGEEISLNPPRIPSNLGGLASEVLGLYPFQALADQLPDALAVPLAPPVNVEMVASAAINVALGIVEGYPDELEGEAIQMAGSVRSYKEKKLYENWVRDELAKDGISYSTKESCSVEDMAEIDEDRILKRIDTLKEKLLKGTGDVEDEIAIMEELECLRPKSMKPAYDPKLNGQWNFVLSKDDLGTSFIKELLPPEYYSFGDDDKVRDSKTKTSSSSQPAWKALLDNLYQLKGLYMRIHDEQSQVEIVLSSKLCFGQIPIDIVFATSLLSTNYDEEPDGTLFLEKFESIIVGGVSLPLPESWQRFRYLEITYLDDDIVIARGSGGDPHVLVRAKE